MKWVYVLFGQMAGRFLMAVRSVNTLSVKTIVSSWETISWTQETADISASFLKTSWLVLLKYHTTLKDLSVKVFARIKGKDKYCIK